jgi:branched-chain amino acid transport system ATP-binding protein
LASEALRLEGVNSFYGDSHVLQDVSFSLQPGKLLALLGRNGAGKSTCISSIVGLVTPRWGKIHLFGEEISGLQPENISHKGIGLVPQGRRIFPSLNVRENLVVARQRVDTVAKPWTLERIFDMFPRLRERQNQMAGSLSGGEQQMLAMGRALMAEPRVLLLDEPSMGLAPLIVEEIFTLIAHLKGLRKTILLVEQNAQLALELADYAYVLETGHVRLSGKASDIATDPAVLDAYLGGH